MLRNKLDEIIRLEREIDPLGAKSLVVKAQGDWKILQGRSQEMDALREECGRLRVENERLWKELDRLRSYAQELPQSAEGAQCAQDASERIFEIVEHTQRLADQCLENLTQISARQEEEAKRIIEDAQAQAKRITCLAEAKEKMLKDRMHEILAYLRHIDKPSLKAPVAKAQPQEVGGHEWGAEARKILQEAQAQAEQMIRQAHEKEKQLAERIRHILLDFQDLERPFAVAPEVTLCDEGGAPRCGPESDD